MERNIDGEMPLAAAPNPDLSLGLEPYQHPTLLYRLVQSFLKRPCIFAITIVIL